MSDTATETPEAAEAPSSPENRVLQKGKLARHLTHERVLPQLSPEIEGKTRLYELCLLFDPAEASRTWDALVEWIKTELIETKYEQHVLRVDKWADTRKLAYEIQGLKRGTYMVVWFRSEPSKLVDLERDLRLQLRLAERGLGLGENVDRAPFRCFAARLDVEIFADDAFGHERTLLERQLARCENQVPVDGIRYIIGGGRGGFGQ